VGQLESNVSQFLSKFFRPEFGGDLSPDFSPLPQLDIKVESVQTKLLGFGRQD